MSERSHLLPQLIVLLFFWAFPVHAMEGSLKEAGQDLPPLESPPPETPLEMMPLPGKLPFAISRKKRLTSWEIAEKREGTFFTGLPNISSDPLNGFGYGADGYLYFNGTKENPLFYYTPYLAKLEMHAFNTTGNQSALATELDIPYIFQSKYRLRVGAFYENSPNELFFGQTTGSLAPLTFQGQSVSSFSQYQSYLNRVRAGGAGEAGFVTDHFYNFYRNQEASVSAHLDRTFFKGLIHVIGGLEFDFTKISKFDGIIYPGINPATGQVENVPNGTTFLTQQVEAGTILGGSGGYVNHVHLGVAYDSRDFEPNPSQGFFAELTEEISWKGIGSSFNFNKTFFQVKSFIPLFSQYFKKLTLASRFGVLYTGGGAPFFQYQDAWSMDGDIEGLGGASTLRGYKQSRFLGRLMNYINVELRYRFYDLKALDQSFALAVVPFFDLGGVWDNFMQYNFKNYRHSEGLGLRVVWNQSTVIRADYAVSSEDQNFYFGYENIF